MHFFHFLSKGKDPTDSLQITFPQKPFLKSVLLLEASNKTKLGRQKKVQKELLTAILQNVHSKKAAPTGLGQQRLSLPGRFFKASLTWQQSPGGR